MASCVPERGLAAAPLPGEVGVYRAGPLTLAVGDDLAQHPRSSGEAIAVLTGDRSTLLSVDPRSPVRASLYYTAPRDPLRPPTINNGRAAVRFPACGQRVHRFGGGIAFAGRGCARLRVQTADGPLQRMLVPIGNSVRGCSVSRRVTTLRLGPGAITIGVSCRTPSSSACGRVAVAVRMNRPATLVTVEVAGRLVTLSPPQGARADLWLGQLWEPSLARRAATEQVDVRARVAAFLGDGTAAAVDAIVPLSTGFG